MNRPARAAEILPRVVEEETLDHLEPDDPAAERSRRDLLRVNRVMGASRILARAMRAAMAGRMPAGRPLRVLEIGCGDGDVLLAASSGLKSWPKADLTLLDRVSLVDFETRRAFATRGWLARTVTADVFQWASAPSHWPRFDLVVANLFLHHFESERLAALLRMLATRCDALVACEPRRVRLALAASHLVGAIGANAVTRKDAVLSVRAGFVGQEISALWPRAGEGAPTDGPALDLPANSAAANSAAANGAAAGDAAGNGAAANGAAESGAAAGDARADGTVPEWQCREYSAGLFSHVFIATRTGIHPAG